MNINNFYKKIISAFLAIIIIAGAFLADSSGVQAAINKEINYQGKLTGASNVAVADGTYAIEFKLYTQLSGGVAVWTETLTGANEVQVTNGLFSVMLGSTTPLTTVDFNQTLYLGVNVESDGEMSPRKIIGAVPAAFVADTLDNLSSEQFLRSDVQNATSSSGTFLNILQTGAGKIAEFFGSASQTVLALLSNGNVGIGTSTPYSKLSVAGTVVGQNFVATSTSSANIFPLLRNGEIAIVHSDGSTSYTYATTSSDAGRGTALLTAMGGATNGDHVYLSAGTFDIGSGSIDLTDGGFSAVSLHGAGKYATVITGSGSPLVKPGSYTDTTDLSLVVSGPGSFRIAWGVDNTGDSVWGARIKNVYARGYEDALYLNVNDLEDILIENVTAESSWDAFVAFTQNGVSNIDIRNSEFITLVDGNLFSPRRSINVSAADNTMSLNIYDSKISSDQNAIYADDRVDAKIYNGVMQGTLADVGTNSTISVSPGTMFDPTNTSGTIAYLAPSVVAANLANYTGNVGIGTTSPYAKLSVAGTIVGQNFVGTSTATSTFGGNLAINGTGTTTSNGGFNIAAGCFAVNGTCLVNNSYGNTDVNAFIHASTTIPKTYTTNTFTALQTFGNASSTQLTTTGSTYLATAGGNVGVGVTSPQAKLEVSSPIGGEGVRLSASGVPSYYHSILTGYDDTTINSSYLGFNIATLMGGTPSRVMTLVGNGNVGIGTTSPYAMLSVAGTVVAQNFVGTSTATSTFGGNLAINGTGTTTSNGGFNIAAGCFAVNGTCLVNNNYSNTDVNAYIHASTTIPKTYTANTFTDLQTLGGGLTVGSLTGPLQAVNGVVSASSTLSVAYGGTGTSTLPTFGKLLVGNSLGGYTLTATSSLGLGTSPAGSSGQIQYNNGGSFGASSEFTYSSGVLQVGFAGAGAISLNNSGGGQEFFINADESEGASFFNGSNAGLIAIGKTSAIYGLDVASITNFDSNVYVGGNTGMGTVNPSRRLTLNGTDEYISFNNSDVERWVMGNEGTFSDRFVVYNAVGSAYVMAIDPSTNNVGFGSTTPGTKLSIGNTGASTISISPTATSTFGYGINLRAGCFAINNSCMTIGSGTAGQVPYYSGTGSTLTATSTLFVASTGKVGIGTTTPFSKLSVSTTGQQSGLLPLFTVASTTNENLFTVLGNGNVGVGTTSPFSTFAFMGNPISGVSQSMSTFSVYGGNGVLSGSSAGAGGGVLFSTGNGVAASTGATGGDYSVFTGTGASSGTSGRGGNVSFSLGNGGNSGIAGGVGGSFSVAAGDGGTGNGPSAGVGGAIAFTAGAGGAQSVSSSNANGGAITFASGAAGAVVSGGANGGNIIFQPGAGSGTGSSGRVGISTTTPGTLLSLGNTGTDTINISTTATSTFGYGINLRAGCFAVNGTCLVNNNYSNTDVNAFIHASTTISKTYTANTFTALQTFGNASTTQLSVSGNTYFPGGIWNSSGNVGIGNTNPTNKFSVENAGALAVNFSDVAASQGLAFYVNSFTPNISGMYEVAGDSLIVGYDFVESKFKYAGDSMTIDSSGNVGIGTTSPYAKLSVEMGTESASFVVANQGSSTPAFVVRGVNGNGSVGIGVANPTDSLQIQTGNLRATIGNFTCGPNFAGLSFQNTPTCSNYSFLADTNDTFFNAGDEMYFRIANDTKMIVKSTGNVGIGTTSPYAKLSVVGQVVGEYFTATSTTATSTFAGSAVIGNQLVVGAAADVADAFGPHSLYVAGADGKNVMAFGNTGQTLLGAFYVDSSNNTPLQIGTISNSNFGFFTNNGSPTMSIYTTGALGIGDYGNLAGAVGPTNGLMVSGNVGIGTTSPYAKLSVAGTVVGQNFVATSTTASVFPYASTTALTSSGSAYFATTGGRVGVGTVSPATLLHLSGATPVLRIEGSVDDNEKISFVDDGSEQSYISNNPGLGLFDIWSNVSHTFRIGTSNLERLTIDFSGNFGINNSAPSAALEIGGENGISGSIRLTESVNDISSDIYTYPDDGYMIIEPGQGLLGVGTGFSPGSRLSVNANAAIGATYATLAAPTNGLLVEGNVGIGTTSPYTKLSVAGEVVAANYIATSSTASAFTKLTLTPLSVGTSLDIFDGSASGSIRLGADVNNSTRSSNVRKLASITAPDYGNTRNIEFISSDSDTAGTNRVYLGGRTGASTYAATDLYLNTATNPSTTGGTTAAYINSSGNMGIGTTTLLSNTKLTLGTTASNMTGLTIKGVTSQAADYLNVKDSAGTSLTRITPGGGILIGSGAGTGYTYASVNGPQLDISYGGVPNALVIGAESNLSTRTNNTSKVGRMALAPYSTNSKAVFVFGGASNSTNNLLTFGGGTSVLQAATQVDFYTAVATNTDTGTSRLTITNTGKVGIHLTTPDTELQVSTSTLARATAGTVELLKLSLPLNGGTAYPQAASFALGTYSSNGAGNGYGPDTRLDVKLKTTSVTDYVTDLTMMTFLDNGRVGIGTTTPYAKLSVAGDHTGPYSPNLFVVASSTPTATSTHFLITAAGSITTGFGTVLEDTFGNISAAGDVCANITGNCVSELSDRRLKTNIQSLGSTLDKVLQLNPVTYRWNELYLKDHAGLKNSTSTKVGFIAQEVQDLFPDLITGDVDGDGGYIGVDYSKFSAVLAEAIKETNVKIDLVASSTAATNCEDGACLVPTINDLKAQYSELAEKAAEHLSMIEAQQEEIETLKAATTSTQAIATTTVTTNEFVIATSTLESIASTTADTLASSTPSFIARVAGAVQEYIASAGEWVLSKITAQVALFDRVETKIAAVSRGLEMKDQATGQIYCVSIKNGEWDKSQGICSDAVVVEDNNQDTDSNTETTTTTTTSTSTDSTNNDDQATTTESIVDSGSGDGTNEETASSTPEVTPPAPEPETPDNGTDGGEGSEVVASETPSDSPVDEPTETSVETPPSEDTVPTP